MPKKKIKHIPNDYVVVKYLISYSPYVKGDITAIPKKEFSYLSKLKVVVKI